MRIAFSIAAALLFAFPVFAQTQGEVIVPTTFMRKSPNATAEKVHTLQKGERVILERERDTEGWYYVSVSTGKVKGWISGNTFRTIETKTETVAQPTPSVKQPSRAAVSETPRKPAPTPSLTIKPQPTKVPPPQIPVANQNATAQTQTVKPAETQTVKPAPSPSAVPTPAPTLQEEEEVLRIETEEVNLNVRVIDANNRPVKNLRDSHFKVFEDGVIQPITSLTTTEVPIVNALVVDNSRSLRAQLEKVIEAGKILIGTNRPQDESSVVRFVSSDKIEIMRDFTSNKRLLEDALNNLFIEGGQTAIIDAVYLTAKRLEQYQNSGKKDDLKRRALIVVSDGDDRGSIYNEQQLFELLRASDVQVYAIGFVSGLSSAVNAGERQSRQEKARAFLTRLAEETGGKVYFPSSLDELPQIAGDISADLRTQYLLTYAPTNEKRDRSLRNIKVEVAPGANDEKRTAITRTGRIAAPGEKPSSQNNQRKP
jgi:Ca-activated chloride channel homolog